MNNAVKKIHYLKRYINKSQYFTKRAASVTWPLIGYCLFKVKEKLLNQTFTRKEIVDFAFNKCTLIRPFQVQSEFLRLLTTLKKAQPRVVLEIGTEKGGVLFLLAQTLPKNVVIISLDLQGGRFGGGYPSWKISIYKSFAKNEQKIHLVRANSHDKKTLKKIKSILNGNKLDFIFIDGDHTYNGVKLDFEMYGSLVKKSGLIAFHDIVPPPPGTGSEVSKYWKEIKQKYKYIEIVEDWSQGWAGIGLIQK